MTILNKNLIKFFITKLIKVVILSFKYVSTNMIFLYLKFLAIGAIHENFTRNKKNF